MRFRTMAVEYPESVPSSPKFITSTSRNISFDASPLAGFFPPNVLRSCFNIAGGSNTAFKNCSRRYGNAQKVGLDIIEPRGIPIFAR